MGVFRAEIDSVFYGPVDGQNCLLLFQGKKTFLLGLLVAFEDHKMWP